MRVAILPTIAGLAKHQSSLEVRQLGEIRGTDAPVAGSLPEPPGAQLEALAWLPRAVLVEMRLVQILAVRLDHMNSSANDTTNPADPRCEPMGLEEAGKVMWLRNNYRPLGDLLDEGYLNQARLEWAAAKAYDPRLKQAAQVLLDCQKRSSSEPPTDGKGMTLSSNPAASRGFLERYADQLAARVKREVRNKLETGLKNPTSGVSRTRRSKAGRQQPRTQLSRREADRQ